MKKRPIRLLLAAAVAICALPVQLGVAGESESFTFRVATPRLETTPEIGGARIELEGFGGRHGKEGAPDVPLRTYLVAIPADATPRLTVQPIGEAWFAAIRPRVFGPLERSLATGPSSGLDSDEPSHDTREATRPGRPARRWIEPDAAIYEGPATFPEQIVWLGSVGRLRDQRYVEVHVAPVRWDGAQQGLSIQPEVEITVHFEGAGRSRASGAGDARFESVYRDALVNYAQGRQFRVDPELAPPSVEVEAAGPGSSPRYRIRVRSNGMLRLEHAFLLANAPDLLPHPTARWRLTSQGVQVPLHVRQISGGGSSNTLLDRSGEFVQFFAQAYDQEPKTTLIGNLGTGDEQHAANDFTDENVYFLSAELVNQTPMPERAAAPGAQPASGPSFIDTLHTEVDNRFQPWKGYDLWYWTPMLFEDPTDPNRQMRTDSIPLPGLWSGTAPFSVRVNVRGASDCTQHCSSNDPESCVPVFESHETGVTLRNASNQLLQLPTADPDNVADVNLGEFPPKEGFTHSIDWVHSGADPQLTSPLNVRTQIFPLPGACSEGGGGNNQVQNDVLLNWIEVDYARELRAVGNTLAMAWPDGSSVRFTVPGFTNNDVEVYELRGFVGTSFVRQVIRLTGVQVTADAGAFAAAFRMDPDPAIADGTPRRFVLVASGAVSIPALADFKRDRVSSLASDPTQADLVVIAHPALIESSCTVGGGACATDADCVAVGAVCSLDPSSSLAQFLDLRDSQGITSRLARLPDVEDEFNHGLSGPLAIEKFLAFALGGGWAAPPPSYVLLLGDGSYDYKGGQALGNFMPTQIATVTEAALAYYSSDNLMADVVGTDRIPDAVLGRLPARTLAEADELLDRISDYDTSAPLGSWRSNALLVSDRGSSLQASDEAIGFEEMSELAIDGMVPPYTHQNLRYWSDNCVPGHPTQPTCNAVEMEAKIKSAVNGTLDMNINGAALLQFSGHGAFDVWSNDAFFCTDESYIPCQGHDDTEDPFNGLRRPWLIAHNCLSGGFHQTDNKTLGEQWLKADAGGAIAVYAPSGLGFIFLGKNVVPDLWEPLFGPAKERQIAVPIYKHLVDQCSGPNPTENCQFYVLLGDPSLRLKLREVDPAKDLVAVAGNGEVNLDWEPSATPGVEYDVYRELTLVPGYDEIATNLTATGFLDQSAENGLEYRYYVVARDPQEFESAWSNFNSDCDEDGPDCVEAMPLNPNSPSKPTGLSVRDLETGGAVEVSWTENPEGDVDVYTLHYGPTPALGQTLVIGPPGAIDLVSPAPVALIFGLENGSPHYFAVSATNTSGLTSVLSDTAEGTPNQVLGVKAPDLIRDLRIGRTGNNAVLTWSPVTRDIYNKPLVVGSYEVFRSTDLHFVPQPANRIATVLTPSHSDPNQFSNPGPDVYYLVRALDLAGNPGGAGHQLPDGIRQLELELSAVPGQLVLSWPAVSLDFDHAPTTITHYELWVSEQPVSRQSIEDGAATLLDDGIGSTTVTIPLEPNEPRYYSVLAVDVRGNRSPF